MSLTQEEPKLLLKSNDLSNLMPSGYYPKNEISYQNRLMNLRDIIIQRNSFIFISNQKTNIIEPVTEEQLQVNLPSIETDEQQPIKRKSWTEDVMLLAIHEKETKGLSVRYLAAKYGIPRTTLSSRLMRGSKHPKSQS